MDLNSAAGTYNIDPAVREWETSSPQVLLFLNYYMKNTDLKKANPQRRGSNHTPSGSSTLTVLQGIESAMALTLKAAQGSPGHAPKIPTTS